MALAVAEAIDEAIDHRERHSQLVTVPALDARLAKVYARFAELKGEILGIKGEITRQMYVAILGQLAVLLGALYFFVTQLRP